MTGASQRRWPFPRRATLSSSGAGTVRSIRERLPATGFRSSQRSKRGAKTQSALRQADREAIADSPDVLAPLRLHYLRWVLFDVGSGLHFQYQGIFDTDFDKYTEDAVPLFADRDHYGLHQPRGIPGGLEREPEAFVKFVREHQFPSFLEYGEYPTSPPTRSKRRCGSKRRSPTCSTRCSDPHRKVHRCLSWTTSSTFC